MTTPATASINLNPLCLLCVIYNNEREVLDFTNYVEAQFGPLVEVAICDNSPHSNSHLFGDRTYIHRPDNPGYLEGALAAWEAHKQTSKAQWVALTNTDLNYDRDFDIATLSDYGNSPTIVAPRIVEGLARIEKNPHLLQPRSRRRHRLNHLATANTFAAYLYLVAAFIRAKRKRNSPQDGRPTIGTKMYSPYGALIIFSRELLSRPDFPREVPLLAEEWAVAEFARRGNVPVVFEPRLKVEHEPHSTTGPKVSLARARMLSKAFRYIAQNGETS